MGLAMSEQENSPPRRETASSRKRKKRRRRCRPREQSNSATKDMRMVTRGVQRTVAAQANGKRGHKTNTCLRSSKRCLLSVLEFDCRLRLQNREANANASISLNPLLSSSIMAIISPIGGRRRRRSRTPNTCH
jgi:hypothetical protein